MGHCNCSCHFSTPCVPTAERTLLFIIISRSTPHLFVGGGRTSAIKIQRRKKKHKIDDTATSLQSLMMCRVLCLFTFISHCTTLFHTSCTHPHFIQTSLQLPLRHFWRWLQKWFPKGSSHKGLVHRLFVLTSGLAYFTHSPEQLTQRGSQAAVFYSQFCLKHKVTTPVFHTDLELDALPGCCSLCNSVICSAAQWISCFWVVRFPSPWSRFN